VGSTIGEARGKVWLEKDGKPLIGKGRAQLLEEIRRTGSIKRAASSVGVSYRYAWDMISRINDACGSPVVSSQRGGPEGGRSKLTDEGEELLRLYREVERNALTSSRSCTDVIHCSVKSIQPDGSVELISQDGEVEVTLRGPEVAGRLGEGDEVLLALKFSDIEQTGR